MLPRPARTRRLQDDKQERNCYAEIPAPLPSAVPYCPASSSISTAGICRSGPSILLIWPLFFLTTLLRIATRSRSPLDRGRKRGSQKISSWPWVVHWLEAGPVFKPRLLDPSHVHLCLSLELCPLLVQASPCFRPPTPVLPRNLFKNRESDPGVSPFSKPSPAEHKWAGTQTPGRA